MVTFEKFIDETSNDRNEHFLTPKAPLLNRNKSVCIQFSFSFYKLLCELFWVFCIKYSYFKISAVSLCFRFYYSSFLGTSNFFWFSALRKSPDNVYAV